VRRAGEKTYGRDAKVLVGKPKHHLEDVSVDEKIIKIGLRKIWWEGVGWAHPARDKG
jgi:hypothetical protein